ncbi:hypothetical protein [Gimesia fumaroli]|uniref:Uncharacterized protein n=1 Tax=Gimesia fumaroli TaxID=2527976 RepID=A0A518IA26_9PLAN|nr:hypothetical protein [Gimesia fumaroli]QDV49869.1 hypothetical protein Enr17x_18900 [Gimesia fumaroli]
MPDNFTFPQQFFAVSSPVQEGRLLMAGGLFPISKPRSAYQASVACFDYGEGEIIWQVDQEKSYPFKAIAQSEGVCSAILPQNFVRCPTGIYRFDVITGEKIIPDNEVSGWKIQHVDGFDQGFVFSWVRENKSFLRVVSHSNETVAEKIFPYDSQAGGKILERVFAVCEDTFITVFSLVKGKKVVYSLERWDLHADFPIWKQHVKMKHVIRNGSSIICWHGFDRPFAAEVYSIGNGKRESIFQAKLSEVVNVEPINSCSFVIQALSGVYIVSTETGNMYQMPEFGYDDFLDFGAIAVDESKKKLLVVTAGNHQRPGTRLTLLDL